MAEEALSQALSLKDKVDPISESSMIDMKKRLASKMSAPKQSVAQT